MRDYRSRLDAEVWAYIERTESFYPAHATILSIAEQRALYEQMCAAFYQGRPTGVQVADQTFGGVPCRRYQASASDVTVIYYHGGGFVVGGVDSHDDVCAEICDRTGYHVASVDYSLAPEHVFPHCFLDAWSAFVAIAAQTDGPIVLAGDSAGGNLAAAVAHHARTHSDARITGQVLIYPGLGGEWGQGSYVEHANAPQLTTAESKFYKKIRLGGKAPPKGDPRFAPLKDTDFTNLPPTVLITAECDPLSSDGEAYRDAIFGVGGKAVWINEIGLVHGYLRARTMSEKAARSFDRIVSSISALGRQDWPIL